MPVRRPSPAAQPTVSSAAPAARQAAPAAAPARSWRRLAGAALGALTLVVGAGAVASPAAYAAPAVPHAKVALPSTVDPIQPYVPQDSCDATAKPGAVALMNLLLATYPGSTNMGIVNTCAAEGMTSEHAEGRALDWGNNAHKPLQKARAEAMLTWLFADRVVGGQEESQVMARRLGVMYVIWNGRIREAGGDWTTYLPGTCWTAAGKPTGDDTTCHRNHVHISLGWSGAWKKTSFWTGKVAPIDYGPCVAKGKKYAPKYTKFNGTPCAGTHTSTGGGHRGSGSGSSGSGGTGGTGSGGTGSGDDGGTWTWPGSGNNGGGGSGWPTDGSWPTGSSGSGGYGGGWGSGG